MRTGLLRLQNALPAWLDPTRWTATIYLSDCDRVGAGVHAIGRPLVNNNGRVEIGSNVTLRSLGSPVRLTATPSGTISVGEDVLLDTGATLFSDSTIAIGSRVVVGPHAVLCDQDESGRSGAIVIEERVRIGAGARIIGPCRIGRDAVVLAGSVVRGDAPAGAVVGSDWPKPADGSNGAPGPVSVIRERVANAATRMVRAVLAADFTIDELSGYLAAPDFDGIAVESEIAPYDQVVPTLLSLSQRETKVDLAIVWTRPDQVCPLFRDALHGVASDSERVLAEVDAFVSILKSHADAARFIFVPSWVLPPWRRGLTLLELRNGYATNVLMRMNLRLAEALSDTPNVFVLDAQRWMAVSRDGAFDSKLWHAAKVAFTTDVFVEAAHDIHAALRGALGLSRKLIVVDLDDTLWGGIVGDVGWEGLRLGGHDPDGEAFVQFQRDLVALTKRGIALAVVSKNEESTALEAMRSHPEMVIRPESLATYRINWQDKAQNIRDLTQDLNLGLQSVVFLDDNPVERARVRDALPEVFVPEWPADPTHYPRALESLRCFDTARITAEDLERNEMYAVESKRTVLRKKVASYDEWLGTLDMTIRFERLDRSNLGRAAQLLNKTNQMNLRTRRLSEGEFIEWSQYDHREVLAVHVSDRFGDSGLTGVLGLERSGADVHVVDYVLSCRVMGRRVEETMLWAAAHRARALGGQKLAIVPIATKKNKPCLDFFARAGLERAADGYVRGLDRIDEPPALVTVEGLS
jgi:FkbH-like protein